MRKNYNDRTMINDRKMMKEAVFLLPGSDCQLRLVVGDLFAQEGLKIVHMSRTFETSGDVVPEGSLIGQLIGLAKSAGADLDGQIDGWCERMSHRGRVDRSLPYRQVRFDAGRLCPVRVGQDMFCLAAFCGSVSPYLADEVSIGDYIRFWERLWSDLSGMSIDRRTVAVAVPGGRYVSMRGGNFSLEQRLSVLVRSYFRSIRRSTSCKRLTVCLTEEDAESLDLSSWQDVLLPYLWRQASLPIGWTEEGEEPSRTVSVVPSTGVGAVCDTAKMFLDDLCEIIDNLSAHNGSRYEQHDGSRRVEVDVAVDTAGLRGFVGELQREHPDLLTFLSRRRGGGYDKNRMFQLLGLLQERSTYFGGLNRRSVVKLGLDSEETVGPRWRHLGENLDNIINYVGQKLTELKRRSPMNYSALAGIIPPEKRKGG